MKIIENMLVMMALMVLATNCSHTKGLSSANKTAEQSIEAAKVGGKAGEAISRYMDRQASEIRTDLPTNVTVSTKDEAVTLIYQGDSLFKDSTSTTLTPAAKTHLNNLAGTLRKYKNTNIVVEGYTALTNDLHKDVEFSSDRAKTVAQYLESQKVGGKRIKYVGYGAASPLAQNNTQQGRVQNRRIEMAIYANDSLKTQAKNGQLPY